MLHLDFSSFSLVEQLALPELSGAPSFSVRDTAGIIFSDFCEKTRCFKEEVEFDVISDRIDFVSPHENTRVIGLDFLEVDGVELKPGDYRSASPSSVVLNSEKRGNGKAIIVLKPLPTIVVGSASIIDRWADDISTGVKYRLMAMPDKPWSNPQLASHYKSLYESRLHDIATDVKNEFSVSRNGNAPFTYSVYGY